MVAYDVMAAIYGALSCLSPDMQRVGERGRDV